MFDFKSAQKLMANVGPKLMANVGPKLMANVGPHLGSKIFDLEILVCKNLKERIKIKIQVFWKHLMKESHIPIWYVKSLWGKGLGAILQHGLILAVSFTCFF